MAARPPTLKPTTAVTPATGRHGEASHTDRKLDPERRIT